MSPKCSCASRSALVALAPGDRLVVRANDEVQLQPDPGRQALVQLKNSIERGEVETGEVRPVSGLSKSGEASEEP
jgi:hypothetical protein